MKIETTAHLQQLIAEEIQSADGDEVVANIYEVVDKIRLLKRPRQVIPIIFRWAEENHPYLIDDEPFRLFIEEQDDYVQALEESISRKPTGLTTGMAYRRANGETDRSKVNYWIAVLQKVLLHPQADDVCREDAGDFIAIQIKRHV